MTAPNQPLRAPLTGLCKGWLIIKKRRKRGRRRRKGKQRRLVKYQQAALFVFFAGPIDMWWPAFDPFYFLFLKTKK